MIRNNTQTNMHVYMYRYQHIYFIFFLFMREDFSKKDKICGLTICRNSLQAEAESPLALMKRVTQGNKMDVLYLHVVISWIFSAAAFQSLLLCFQVHVLFSWQLLGMTLMFHINQLMALFHNFEYHLDKSIRYQSSCVLIVLKEN